MTHLATDNLAELVRKKHQILTQLRDIGRRQAQLVDASLAADLMQLLTAKQHLINALEMVERHLRPFHDEDPDCRQWRSPADRAACAQQAEACRSLLAEVVELEKKQEARMTERRDQVAAQLKQAGAAREVAGAYHQNSGPSRLPAPHLPSPTGDPTTVARLDLSTGAR